MNFTVLTLFPELVTPFFTHGMMARGIEKKVIQAQCINIRDFARDRHRTVDDRPYGGGSGMVMKPDPLTAALDQARECHPQARVVLMSPQGARFDQQMAGDLAGENRDMILICGRYEGIDERIYDQVDEEISLGDFVLTGGELSAMAVMDAVSRLIPGVLGNNDSFVSESFMDLRLEHAQYTRPEVFKQKQVPGVLLSGNHEKIRQWQKRSSLARTFIKRPDLFQTLAPDEAEKKILRQWHRELEVLIHG